MSHPSKKVSEKDKKKRNMKVPLEDFYDEFDFERALFAALKEARIEAGLSQNDLAKKIGVHQSAIARFESNKFNPNLTFLKKIILALGLELTITKQKPIN